MFLNDEIVDRMIKKSQQQNKRVILSKIVKRKDVNKRVIKIEHQLSGCSYKNPISKMSEIF